MSASAQAVGSDLSSVQHWKWFRGARGSSPSGEETLDHVSHETQVQRAREDAPRNRWLRPPRSASHVDQANQVPTGLGVSQEGSGEGETVELVQGGSGRKRGAWFRHTRGGSDLSEGTRTSSCVEYEESYASFEGKNTGGMDAVSSHVPFPRLGGWLRSRSVRGQSHDAEDVVSQGTSLAGISTANLRGVLQSADGAITVHNEELDEFAKELRQQFIGGEHELPTIVLQVGADGGEIGTSEGASAASRAAGGPPVASERNHVGRLRQLVSRGHSLAGEPVPSVSGAAAEMATEASGSDAALPTTSREGGARCDGQELDRRQKQVIHPFHIRQLED